MKIAGDRDIDGEAVEALLFTRQALQKSMRLFPPVPGLGRQARQDTTIGSHAISKKSPVFVPIWSLHRNEKIWDDPKGFDPNRFSAEKVRARHRFAYLPFGGGPRICIGMGFAMLEMIVILATLIRDFSFKTVPGFHPELAPNVTLRPRDGLLLFVEPTRSRRTA